MHPRWCRLVALCCTVLLVAGVLAPAASARGVAQSAGNDDLPPGVTADGVANATALVEAHRTALAETGYTILTRSSSEAPAFGVETEGQSVVAAGPGHTPFRATTTARLGSGNDSAIPGMDGRQGPAVNATGPPNATGPSDATGPGNGSGPPGATGQTNATDGPNATAGPLGEDATISVDRWGNGTVVLSRIRMDDRTRHLKQYVNESAGPFDVAPVTVSPDRLAADLTGANLLRGVLRLGNYSVVETRTVGNATLTTLRADEPADAGGIGAGGIERFDAALVVDQRGRVHSLNLTIAGDRLGNVSYSSELLALGDPGPVEPAWSDEARATVVADVSIEPAADQFVVTNERGDALPANATVTAVHGGTNETLELGESLAPGESAYVSYPADGSAPVLTRDPPASETVRALAGEYEFVVRSPDGRILAYSSFGLGNATADDAGANVSAAVEGS